MHVPRIEYRAEHLGPVRRFMSGDPDGVEVFESESVDPDVMAERLLFLAAFTVAVRRRFGVPGDRAEVIRFIADMRMVLSKDVEDLDPKITEDFIRGALGQLHPREGGQFFEHLEEVIQATVYVLARLRNQGIVGKGGLEQFLEETLAQAGRSQDALFELLEEDDQFPWPPEWRIAFDQ
jgi:hypothetical protein